MHCSLPLSRYFVIAFMLAWSFESRATHFRAGEITAKRISETSLTYEIKLTAYFDYEEGKQAADASVDVEFYFGNDGPKKVPRVTTTVRNIGNNTTFNEYITTYTFPSAGRYNVSINMEKRNANTLNLNNGISTESLNFFVHSILEINANFGLNQTPVLLNAPIDVAAVGQRYIHNPNAFDADGDSRGQTHPHLHRWCIPEHAHLPGAGIIYRGPAGIARHCFRTVCMANQLRAHPPGTLQYFSK